MLKIRFEYDLPEYDPSKHDPDKIFGFLTYRGIHYAKWIDLKSRTDKIWKYKSEDLLDGSFFYEYNYTVISAMEKDNLKLIVGT